MRVNRHAITQQDLKRSKEAIEKIKKSNFKIVDGGHSIDDIYKWGIRGARDGAVALFIDNLLTISAGSMKFDSKPIMYDYFIKRLKALRDEIKIPVILLAHPNKEGNIAWSTDVENIADIVIFMANFPADEESINVRGRKVFKINDLAGEHVIASFQKFRDGPTPTASLDFVKEYQTFKHIRWE